MTLVAFVGLPGSGKSTLGRQLARRLSVPFADTDALIESRIGCPIRVFFDERGEDAFRQVEHEVLAEYLDAGRLGVISTGGGIVLRPQNRQLLRARARVVYLRSTPDELGRRLQHDTTRPLLQGQDRLAKLQDLYAERDPLYREVASLTVETARRSVAMLAAQLHAQLAPGPGTAAAAPDPDGPAQSG